MLLDHVFFSLASFSGNLQHTNFFISCLIIEHVHIQPGWGSYKFLYILMCQPLVFQYLEDISFRMLMQSLFFQIGGIDEASLDRLSLVTEMSKRIRVRASGEKSTASEIGQFSPIFVWLLRVMMFVYMLSALAFFYFFFIIQIVALHGSFCILVGEVI